MSAPGGPWGLAALTGAVVVVADQASKAVVRRSIEPGETRRVTSFLDLVHVRNDGVAFGQLAGGGVVVAVVIALALAALVGFFAANARTPLIWLPIGLVLGGALGNLVDRVRLGAVTDFVEVPHWPAFNLADSAITVGVLSLLVVVEHAARRRP